MKRRVLGLVAVACFVLLTAACGGTRDERAGGAAPSGTTRSAEGTTGYQAGYRVAASYPEEDCEYAADLMVNAAGGVESKADADFLRDYMQGCEAWHDDND